MPQTIPFQLTEEDVSTLADLFRGKEFGFARYQVDGKGNLVPVYVNRLPGADELAAHLNGKIVLGIYPLRSDKTLKFSVVRIRIPHRRLLANAKNEGFLALSEDHIHHYAKGLFDTMKGYGMPVYLENFGGRGRRVWFFFEEFIPVERIEHFLNHCMDLTPAPGVDLSIDLLLGFKGAGIGLADDPIPLPLGIDPLTGKRCFYIDGEGKPYEDQLLFIRKIRTIDQGQVQSFLKMGRTPKPWTPSSLSLLKKLESQCPAPSLQQSFERRVPGEDFNPMRNWFSISALGF